MGKKGKVNKLAKMSDEERARYLQLRADMEEEARRRKQELIHRFIKNKLDKEEAFSRLNTAKLNQQWRYILRKIKCKQMAVDIQNMLTSFNFLVERKNRLIKTLMKATDDSDEQHRRAFQAHTENVSYFLNIGSQRLDKLQAEYDYQKNTLLENWDREEMDLVDSQDRAEFKLKLIAYINDRDFQALKKSIEMQRATEKNDARLEHEEELRSFSVPKQLDIEMYWSKLREVYTTYQEEHSPIMGHYHSLREKDDFYQKEIARNDYQIQLATENLLNLQHEWQKTTSTMTAKLTRMANRKEELAHKYLQMKRDSKIERSKGSQQLNIMVNTSQDAIKHLENMHEKLNKVLQLADICSKYEHAGDELTQDVENDLESVDFEHLDKAMIDECKEYSKMDKFLLKVNRAKVQTICLRTEKAKLVKENMQLKNYIKRYLTDLALKGKDRPLSMRLRTEVPKIDTKAFPGVCNFNGKHGCMKCVTVGEYSHQSHTVVFPDSRCPDRTDDQFRKKMYGLHHKADSPLLQLPIDMVKDVPVADSLHLIDLGVMKRLLVGWRDGNFGKYITKWCARDINNVATFLNNSQLPSEIHRSMRGLDQLAHWKASEYRTFLYYLSIIILPQVLRESAYSHFLCLFCGITICSSKMYENLLPLAEKLLLYFVEHYKDHYGADYVTSNVHNIVHVVDEVQRFGPLQTFNAYPFENKLYLIKRMLRDGKNPLRQVANRLNEEARVRKNITSNERKETKCDFEIKINKNKTEIQFKEFKLNNKSKDKFFMSTNNDIMEIEKILKENENIFLHVFKVSGLTEVFDQPVKSSYFNIFKSKVPTETRTSICLSPQDVKFKFVCNEYRNELYFVPLLHTVYKG